MHPSSVVHVVHEATSADMAAYINITPAFVDYKIHSALQSLQIRSKPEPSLSSMRLTRDACYPDIATGY